MPTITTEVEIYINPDDFTDMEIIEEIKSRRARKGARDRQNFTSDVIAAVSGNSGVMSLEDAIKMELFEKHMRKISINDLDQFLGAL